MTTEEIRLAKLSRTLNNTTLSPTFYPLTDSSAYKNTIQALESSLLTEKYKNKEDQSKFQLSVQAKLNEESLKQLAIKHHSTVLEAQIKENELKKKLIRQSPQPTYASFKPDTPPMKNLRLREELLEQIKEKESRLKSQAVKDLTYGQKIIEDSQKALELELQSKNQARNLAYREMVESWEENLKVKHMAKQLEHMRMYGPKVEPVVSRYVAEEIDEEEEKEKKAETICGNQKVEKRVNKKVDKQFNWKSNLRSSSVRSPMSSKSGKSYNSVIEQFSKLNSLEKKVKNDKERLLNYFKEKKRIKESRGEVKLPKIR